MKKDLRLTASVDEPKAFENMSEQLTIPSSHRSCTNVTVPPSWQAIDTSSPEIYMNVRGESDRIILFRLADPYFFHE